MSSGYSNRLWECPFFTWDSKDKLRCEAGTIDFRKKPNALNGYISAYCAGDWKRCTLARALLLEYESEEKRV